MDHRVQLTIALMQVDLRREQSLDELARRVSLSRSRFQHLFKAETGTSPAHYLRDLTSTLKCNTDYARGQAGATETATGRLKAL